MTLIFSFLYTYKQLKLINKKKRKQKLLFLINNRECNLDNSVECNKTKDSVLYIPLFLHLNSSFVRTSGNGYKFVLKIKIALESYLRMQMNLCGSYVAVPAIENNVGWFVMWWTQRLTQVRLLLRNKVRNVISTLPVQRTYVIYE